MRFYLDLLSKCHPKWGSTYSGPPLSVLRGALRYEGRGYRRFPPPHPCSSATTGWLTGFIRKWLMPWEGRGGRGARSHIVWCSDPGPPSQRGPFLKVPWGAYIGLCHPVGGQAGTAVQITALCSACVRLVEVERRQLRMHCIPQIPPLPSRNQNWPNANSQIQFCTWKSGGGRSLEVNFPVGGFPMHMTCRIS